ncbi:hypothetical protein QE152_g13222 [Popillia japonica]|uniref:Uncharacterized protein n=1 Tax=Popillia japonica TaxID=7064 RepID=A0AAW1LFW7_POPJA
MFLTTEIDQCVACVKYHQASADVKVSLEEEYKAHLRRKDQAQEAKKADKERTENDNSFMSVIFDLQSVLQIPSSKASLTYYMRKLIMYNLTVYEAAAPNKAFCFCWTEINGNRGSCEIGTCLLKYIKSLPPNIKFLPLFSDTCGGQNRNLQISALLLYVLQNSQLEVIEQTFLESGHSLMEMGSMHSAIERQKRFVSVFCVNDWMNIFKLARSKRGKNKNKPPYETEELKFSDILDLKELSAQLIKNKSIDENGEKSAQVASKPLRNFDHHDVYKANTPLEGLQSLNLNFEHPLPRRSIQFPRSGQAFCYTQPSLNAIWVSWAKYVPSELFRLQKDLE